MGMIKETLGEFIMIYAKTNLKKIPETCNKCKFSFQNKYFGFRHCILLNAKKCEKVKTNLGNWKYERLKECPLIEMK